jgi:superfamily I DNA and/or RNA helicase
MTPENALGAIMRARQVVIVGDTKQLPPTSFFSKVLDDADEDEDTRTDSESILDMANATFTPVRQLRWHYRSRHPDLIAISNKMVYDGQLTIFPAARDGDPQLGVDLVKVEGAYRKGRNIPEARAIVAGAIQHMRDHPERSLGLATMNKDQTELIVSEFERDRARHPHVEAYIDRWAEKDDGLEEFFVKNLETIQGDERDVIMISTLYGPDLETGKTYQRFGPVNSVHGHRRLNVLFSRAKEKIVTYSSMVPTDI